MCVCPSSFSRDGTEELLMKEELGSFLLRQSRSEDHQYDLCVRSEHDIKNVRIAQMDSRGFCITEEHFFPSLTQLVKHYRNHVGQTDTHTNLHTPHVHTHSLSSSSTIVTM